jgi:hypothetical protein
MAKKATSKKTAAKKAAIKRIGAPQRKPESYLTVRAGTAFSLVEYTRQPATSFLTQVVEAKNTFDYCKRKFERSGKLTNEAKDNLQQVTGPLFAATMGHFETFQKCLFAGLFDATRLLQDWDPGSWIKSIGEGLDLSIKRLIAYRGQGAQVGLLIADASNSWHSPSKVNEFFACFGSGPELFSTEEVRDLEVLWQIRHTLVHTGGWLTLPDAQKVKRLSKCGDSALAFDELFMLAFARLMHKIAKNSVGRMEKKLRPRLRSDLDKYEQDEFDRRLNVSSPSPSFFPNN